MTDETRDEPGNGGEQSGFQGQETVGEILVSARERSGLSLESISLETKIPKKTLEYLETDNFDAIPAKVYVKGFLRNYAAVLGLDAGHILSRYEIQTGQDHKSKGDLWEIEEDVVDEKIAPPALLRHYILPVAVLAVVLFFVFRSCGGEGDKVSPPRDMPTVEQGEAGAAGPAEREEDGDDQKPDRPRDETVSRAAGSGGGGESPIGDEEELRISDAAGPSPLILRITANPEDTTWFDLVVYTDIDSRPDSIMRDFILFPGQVQSFNATGSFLFKTIGNAGGFSMTLDGRELPSLGKRGSVKKNIRVTREGISTN